MKIYRGYSASSELDLIKQNQDLLDKKARISDVGTSATGQGLYFTSNKSEAEDYMTRRKYENNHKYGNVVSATIDDAKIVKYYDLSIEKSNEASDLLSKALEINSKELGDKSDEIRNMDIGKYAKKKDMMLLM